MPKNNSFKKVVLTGGHAATTALSVIEEIIRRYDNWEINWIGVVSAFEGKKIPTLESKVFPERGVKFFPIITGRLQKKFTIWTIPSISKIPFGFLHAFSLLRRIRPNLVLSFGGFAAYPVVVAAYFLKIPIIIHEQTSVVGRANKYSARFAKKIAISRESSLPYFPKTKTTLTGNPLMTQIWEVEAKTEISKPPLIFVTGGSRGSQTINELVGVLLRGLLETYVVVHQTGYLDFEKYKNIRDSLPVNLKNRYEVYSTIDPMSMDGVYKRADIIIARAGANTVGEIIAIKRPAILIPIPWVENDEQRKNALEAEKFGNGFILDQNTLTPKVLKNKIEEITKNYSHIVGKVLKKSSPDFKAEARLVDLVEKCIK